MQPKLFHNALIETCKEHPLRKYLPVLHGKMPNGDGFCLKDGGSDRLHTSNGVSLSCELGIPSPAQTFVYVPIR